MESFYFQISRKRTVGPFCAGVTPCRDPGRFPQEEKGDWISCFCIVKEKMYRCRAVRSCVGHSA